MMTDDQQIFDIYHRFCREIKSQAKDIYYDEEDLIMIFDLASDLRDSYIQLEVLMLGRKLFPESEELAHRQGLMINPEEEKSLKAFLESNSGRKGLLWDILRLKAARLNRDEAIEAIDKILDETRLTDDEEIIQLAELINYYELSDWFATNYRRFIDKSDFRDTALNEASMLLEDTDTQAAVSVLEELSRIDPFNAETWMKLAELYLYTQRLDDAASAIDLAVAIQPDDEAIKELNTKILKIKSGDILADFIGEDILSERVNELLDMGKEADALKLLITYDANCGGVYQNAYSLIQLLYNDGDMQAICNFMDRKRPDDSPELRLDPLSISMYAAALLRVGRYSQAKETASQYLLDTAAITRTLNDRMALAGTKIALNFILTEATKGNWDPCADPISIALS